MSRRPYRLFRNGDKCPCCGSVIEGRSEEWLKVFSDCIYMSQLFWDNSMEDDEVSDSDT